MWQGSWGITMKHAKLISKMTLQEKCALLSGRDVWHTRAIERLHIPSITLADGPSGLRKQLAAGDHLGLNESSKATCIPSSAAYANSWDTDTAYQAGKLIGAEAAAQTVQVLLAPGLNIKRNPLCGRNFEYYSEDPYLSGKMAAAFVQGVQANGVASCVKHFAANNQETYRMHNDSIVDERTLRELYLTGFEIAVREGKPKALMTSYNKVNGVYANENVHLLQDIVAQNWEFQGAVITDWGGSNDFVEGVRAGMNLEMPSTGDDSAVQLLHAVQNGEIEESLIDKRVNVLLELILSSKAKAASVPVDMDEQHEAARKLAESSIVLLKNEHDILPLKVSEKVAVIGDLARSPRFQGAGSSNVNAAKIDIPAVVHEQGVYPYGRIYPGL